MKPRTPQEKEVYRLSQMLKPMTDRQSRWAVKAIAHVAHSTGKTQWCTACGEVMPHGVATCPCCGTKLDIKVDNRRVDNTIYYAVIHTTFHGYQLARYYQVTYEARKGYAPSQSIAEVVQEWLNVDTGTTTLMARNVKMHNFYYDLWNLDTPLTIKQRGSNYYERSWQRYHIWSEVERWESLHPRLKRNGAQRHDMGVQPMELYSLLLKDPFVEELAKTQPKLLWSHIVKNEVKDYIHAVRICNRNNYKIADGKMWIDYIKLLDEMNLDTHNAHYVCPQDLLYAHDRLNARKTRRDIKKRLAQERENIKRNEALYKKLHDRFLAIHFGNKDIEISVAQSVNDIFEEAMHMHHCVYNNGYYKNKDSLILFARHKDTGARIETIEIDLKNFKVAQSRGVCNGYTSYHDTIVKLCNKNMHLLKAVA